MAMKGFNVYNVTQQPRLPPITTVKLPFGKFQSNALDLHSEFRRKWNPIHCTHQGTSQEQRQSEAIACFKNLLDICQESFFATPFRMEAVSGEDLFAQVQRMRPSTGGLDGFLVKELKTLPVEFWHLRAEVENLGEAARGWPLAQYYAYQAYAIKEHDGIALSSRPLRIYNLLNRIYVGARCRNLETHEHIGLHPNVYGAEKNKEVLEPYLELGLDITESCLNTTQLVGGFLDYF